MRRLHRGWLAAPLLLLATGCGNGGPDAATGGTPSTEIEPAPELVVERVAEPDADTATGSADVADALRVLVVGIDGPASPGLDAAVTTLLASPGTRVVAASTSGAGAPEGSAATMSGYPVRVLRSGIGHILDGTDGLDDPPHLVVVGVTTDDVVGSGTTSSAAVAIAQQSVASGIPAVVVGAGGSEPDFAAAALELARLLELELDRLLVGDAVTVLAVPSCLAGSIRGRVDVRVAEGERPPVAVDCTADAPAQATDVDALAAGHVTLAVLPG